ncbi:hypothetical protein SAMN02745181_0398 [Rubritalea squalenifaciens DSM 18772]|uniref:Response receiver domain-containing protein n=1 Tax=Rubritalea squalenifaciens DSM 18772 TaxID=1123071 RepID=A0A1M6C629_9BACT|nr:response regulator receiver domain [Rubritalea squalenifaciens]SHI56480.1 hypothetical protein SAMN02745181_0398 [Rubritalea squalenifaciens DSM 18772]
MPSNTVIRKRVIKEFCKSLVWIDDQILPESDDPALRLQYREFYHPISKAISDEGIICHLRGFPSIRSLEEDDYSEEEDIDNDIQQCSNLATQADIIILDWHLGYEDRPELAVRIIKEIASLRGARFLVILSRKENLTSEFKSEFPEFERNGDWFTNGQLNVVLKHKQDFDGEDNDERVQKGRLLLEEIFNQLSVVYPDYLHWAAIELSSAIKRNIPSLLSALPCGTDLGVLTEKHHSQEDVRHAICENLLEDLKETIDPDALHCLSDDLLKLDAWDIEFRTGFNSEISQLRTDALDYTPPEGAEDLSNPHSDLAKYANKLNPSGGKVRGISDYKRMLNAIRTNFNLVNGHQKINDLWNANLMFSEFAEIRSNPSPNQKYSHGSIMTTNAAQQAFEGRRTPHPSIFICISENCDCAWSDHLLFLEAELVSSHGTYDDKDGYTFLRFKGNEYVIKTGAKNLHRLSYAEGTKQIADHIIIGRIREFIISRISGRYWSHATRVGVNQPMFLRHGRTERG